MRRKLIPLEVARLRSTDNNSNYSGRLYGVIDNVRSMHNIGSIFRTADGAGVSKLYLCGITATPPRQEIRKTSLGAEESVEWEYSASPLKVVEKLQAQGVQVVVLEHTTDSIDFREAHYAFPCCLVVGHEHRGVSEAIIEKADLAIDIPMRGIKGSLNVSVAFGITIYEIAHRCFIERGD